MTKRELQAFVGKKHEESEIREFVEKYNYELTKDISLINKLIVTNILPEDIIQDLIFYSASDIWPGGRLNFVDLIQFQNLSAKFLDKFCRRFDSRIWRALPYYQHLTHKFIVDNIEKFDLRILLESTKMEEKTLDEIWNYLQSSIDIQVLTIKTQKMSDKFICKHAKEINIPAVLMYKDDLTDETYRMLKKFEDKKRR